MALITFNDAFEEFDALSESYHGNDPYFDNETEGLLTVAESADLESADMGATRDLIHFCASTNYNYTMLEMSMDMEFSGDGEVAITEGWKEVKEKLSGWKDRFVAQIKKIWENVKKFFASLIEGIKSWFAKHFKKGAPKSSSNGPSKATTNLIAMNASNLKVDPVAANKYAREDMEKAVKLVSGMDITRGVKSYLNNDVAVIDKKLGDAKQEIRNVIAGISKNTKTFDKIIDSINDMGKRDSGNFVDDNGKQKTLLGEIFDGGKSTLEGEQNRIYYRIVNAAVNRNPQKGAQAVERANHPNLKAKTANLPMRKEGYTPKAGERNMTRDEYKANRSVEKAGSEAAQNAAVSKYEKVVQRLVQASQKFAESANGLEEVLKKSLGAIEKAQDRFTKECIAVIENLRTSIANAKDNKENMTDGEWRRANNAAGALKDNEAMRRENDHIGNNSVGKYVKDANNDKIDSNSNGPLRQEKYRQAGKDLNTANANKGAFKGGANANANAIVAKLSNEETKIFSKLMNRYMKDSSVFAKTSMYAVNEVSSATSYIVRTLCTKSK